MDHRTTLTMADRHCINRPEVRPLAGPPTGTIAALLHEANGMATGKEMQVVFSHGRFADQPLPDIPKHHLQWALVMNVGDAPLRSEIEHELERRP